LASGSSGNAALLEANGFGLLIDCGLHPRMLTSRLREVGSSWDKISAVVLTHTHSDHWKDLTLADLRSRKIPVHAHAAQLEQLRVSAPSFEALHRARLTRVYRDGHPVEFAPGLLVRPVRVSHDADPTFAFRIDHHDADGLAWGIGYASDLGCGSPELIEAFAGVDVLALEFNHDVKLERASRRPQFLVDRVLGDYGHLSNAQAGELAAEIAARSGDGFPGHLVQLHLSRECNRPELALAAGRAALATLNPRTEIVTARQDIAAKSIQLTRTLNSANRLAARKNSVRRAIVQPTLPGFEG
jgi:phosphoribosyl 1,2-cyclic phosphodiesterase